MRREVLLELFYWPPVSWLALAWNTDVLWLEACEHYQKGSYRNRCYIAGSNGIQRLSVPLQKGKNHQMPIRDVRIAYDMPWQRLQWRTIQTTYGRAPFFAFFADEVALFFGRKYTFLFDLNLEVLDFLLKKMRWPGEVRLTEHYHPLGEEPIAKEGVWDARGRIAPEMPAPVPLARYPQVFEDRLGFLPDLSALDLLFCRGPHAFD